MTTDPSIDRFLRFEFNPPAMPAIDGVGISQSRSAIEPLNDQPHWQDWVG